MSICKILFNTHWCYCVICLALAFRAVLCFVKEDEFLNLTDLPVPDLYLYPSKGFRLMLPALPEEVVNVSFFANVNKKRDRGTKDLIKHVTGFFQKLPSEWAYENEDYVFKSNDTLYTVVGFLLRDTGTFWKDRTFDIWHWRRKRNPRRWVSVSTTPLIDLRMFDIFAENIANLHPAVKAMVITTRVTKKPRPSRRSRIPSTRKTPIDYTFPTISPDMSDTYLY